MNQEILNQFTVLANLPGNQSYLLSHKETNEIFVLKTVLSRLSYDDQVRALQKRYNELQQCQNLCKICYYQIEKPSNISILYQEPKINFRKEISARMLKKQFWNSEELLNTFWHTLVALNNFHYIGLFHGDIRVNSIACKSDGSIILLDQFCTGNAYYKTIEDIIADQDGFLSPEFLDPNQELVFTTIENDVFSLGLVFFEACTLKKSRDMYDWQQRTFNYQIYQERLLNIELLYGKELAQFLSQMTDFSIQSRITTEEALVEISQLKSKLIQRDIKVNDSCQTNSQRQQQANQLAQSHFSHQQQYYPHYQDQSNVQVNSVVSAVASATNNPNINYNSNKYSGISFDNGMNSQNYDTAYNIPIDRQIQSSFQQKQQFKLNINYNNQNNKQSNLLNSNEQNSGKLSQLLTNDTIKDNSKNQEITQFENLSISDNSVSILSFENTMCSHQEDSNADKRKQIPHYKKSVFKVKNMINAPPPQQNQLLQNEKESSVFYIVEEEEAIDKQLIQKTMVNRIEKEKRELAQTQNSDANQFLNYAQYCQMQERQKNSLFVQNNQIFQQSQLYQRQSLQSSLSNQQQTQNQLNHPFQQQQEIQQLNQQTQQQNYKNQCFDQQQKEFQQSQIVNKIPANPRSQQVSIQVRRNSAFLPNQQIINQKENINQNVCQIIDDQGIADGSQQANYMIPDQFTNCKNVYTRKIRGLNKSVDMSKAIQLVSNQQQIINNANQQNFITSCKYSNKQEITFPSSVLNSSNSSINPTNNQQKECEGINIISYDIMNMQSPTNIITKNEKQGIQTLFKRNQNIFSSKLTQANNNLKEFASAHNSQTNNKPNPNNNNNNNNNNMYNPINNEEWNYPTNSQRFAYIQINK
ncbi:hypothetical protein TTHERM_00125320 (macronuclear) [Tetrahymena thermophila SB210]|uniref:Protein kinase domain-containing protein n=1 Tax=Tetrahymena thermophila (strain SB210) TaxID=312017 RepID=I7MJ51_TETTS|nr:hypothetical protein TTHERM_00125320 [Tetrahymena thermophila SB210]EAR95966.2 hypothetical protein TTHERM_00125320 [Tetrahymena thermophila SB210]|eukprot:XP_001016211.2 hypothetical protein TTHERM_00125320 [Tetrahymena thermophila SB210]